MPSAMRRSTLSPNTNHASSAVNTPSALSSSDASDAACRETEHQQHRPGDAARRNRRDEPAGLTARKPHRRLARDAAIEHSRPRPEIQQTREQPRIDPSSSRFASGVPAPNSNAATRCADAGCG